MLDNNLNDPQNFTNRSNNDTSIKSDKNFNTESIEKLILDHENKNAKLM